MIRSRHLDPRFSAFDSRKLVQQFNGYWLVVELHPTAFSSVPSPMSGYTRQSFCTRSDVELHSTTLSALPGPVSSYTRQPFCTRSNIELHLTALLYQVECRVTLDSPSVPGPMSSYTRQSFCTNSNIELHSTALLYQVQCRVALDSPSVPIRISSYTRQPFCTNSNIELHSTALLHQVQCRVTLDSPFFCTRSSVELKSTRCLVYHVLRSSKLLRSNGCFCNPNINRFSGKIWTRLSGLTVTSCTAKGRSCWLSQNIDAERGNEECGILSLGNQCKYPRTQCR